MKTIIAILACLAAQAQEVKTITTTNTIVRTTTARIIWLTDTNPPAPARPVTVYTPRITPTLPPVPPGLPPLPGGTNKTYGPENMGAMTNFYNQRRRSR